MQDPEATSRRTLSGVQHLRASQRPSLCLVGIHSPALASLVCQFCPSSNTKALLKDSYKWRPDHARGILSFDNQFGGHIKSEFGPQNKRATHIITWAHWDRTRTNQKPCRMFSSHSRIDTCIGANNHLWFIIVVIFFISGTIFGSHHATSAICYSDKFLQRLWATECDFIYDNYMWVHRTGCSMSGVRLSISHGTKIHSQPGITAIISFSKLLSRVKKSENVSFKIVLMFTSKKCALILHSENYMRENCCLVVEEEDGFFVPWKKRYNRVVLWGWNIGESLFSASGQLCVMWACCTVCPSRLVWCSSSRIRLFWSARTSLRRSVYLSIFQLRVGKNKKQRVETALRVWFPPVKPQATVGKANTAFDADPKATKTSLARPWFPSVMFASFLSRARRSQDGLMESCICHHCHGGPHPDPRSACPWTPPWPWHDMMITWWVLHSHVTRGRHSAFTLRKRTCWKNNPWNQGLNLLLCPPQKHSHTTSEFVLFPFLDAGAAQGWSERLGQVVVLRQEQRQQQGHHQEHLFLHIRTEETTTVVHPAAVNAVHHIGRPCVLVANADQEKYQCIFVVNASVHTRRTL